MSYCIHHGEVRNSLSTKKRVIKGLYVHYAIFALSLALSLTLTPIKY